MDMEGKECELRISTQRARIRRAQERARQYVKPGTLVSEELSAERREAARHEQHETDAAIIILFPLRDSEG